MSAQFDPTGLSCIATHLRRATRVVTRYYDDALRPSGVRITQFSILAFVANARHLSQTELANLMLLDLTTLSRSVRPLRDAGWIKLSSVDQRERVWVLTEKGKTKYREARQLWLKAQAELESRLGAAWPPMKKNLVKMSALLESK